MLTPYLLVLICFVSYEDSDVACVGDTRGAGVVIMAYPAEIWVSSIATPSLVYLAS